MTNQIKQHLQSRQHAGILLAEKVKPAKIVRPDSVVVGIPQGGIPVARQVALSFEVPFEIVFSKRIKHPAHSDQSIGTVSLTEVVLHESTQFIPQSYVLNQINVMQRRLNEQFKEYYGDKGKKSLKGKTILLVDDVLRDVDELASCLAILEKEDPERIIVAAAVASIRVIQYLEEENLEHYYLYVELNQQSKAYTYFPELSEEEKTDFVNSALFITL